MLLLVSGSTRTVRGLAPVSLRLGPWHLTLVLTRLTWWLYAAAWGWDRVGGCTVYRLGPLAINHWRPFP